MKFQFSFHQVDVSSALREYSESQFEKAGSLLLKDSQWKIFYSMRRHECHVSVTVQCGWGHFKASSATSDFYASVDEVAEKLHRQFQKRKEVLQYHKNPAQSRQGKLDRMSPALDADYPNQAYRKAS